MARLLVSVLHAVGGICNPYYSRVTLTVTLIFAAVVSYDVFSFNDVIIVFVYM